MDIRNCEQRIWDIALFENESRTRISKIGAVSGESDQAQREKINLCEELETRNRLFRELHKQELMNCPCFKRGILRL